MIALSPVGEVGIASGVGNSGLLAAGAPTGVRVGRPSDESGSGTTPGRAVGNGWPVAAALAGMAVSVGPPVGLLLRLQALRSRSVATKAMRMNMPALSTAASTQTVAVILASVLIFQLENA